MSAGKIPINVPRVVQTQLDHTHVAAMLDILLPLIEGHVKVECNGTLNHAWLYNHLYMYKHVRHR